MATVSERVKYAPVENADELFTPEFIEYLTLLHDRFTPMVHALRAKRAEVLEKILHQGVSFEPPPGIGDKYRGLEGPSCPRRFEKARYRNIGAVLNHRDVHQCP